MSSIVVEMDIPRKCTECPLRAACDRYKRWYSGNSTRSQKPTIGMAGCLIVCLLPERYGRLGDLDKIQKAINKARIEAMQKGLDTNPYWLVLDIIAQTTAVVPAQKNKVDI